MIFKNSVKHSWKISVENTKEHHWKYENNPRIFNLNNLFYICSHSVNNLFHSFVKDGYLSNIILAKKN